MSCALARISVHGYFDRELDAVRAASYERHLQACSECRRTLEAIEALHVRLQDCSLYYSATPRLAKRITRLVEKAGGARALAFPDRTWAALGAGMSFGFGVGWLLAGFRVKHGEAPQKGSARVTKSVPASESRRWM